MPPPSFSCWPVNDLQKVPPDFYSSSFTLFKAVNGVMWPLTEMTHSFFPFTFFFSLFWHFSGRSCRFPLLLAEVTELLVYMELILFFCDFQYLFIFFASFLNRPTDFLSGMKTRQHSAAACRVFESLRAELLLGFFISVWAKMWF